MLLTQEEKRMLLKDKIGNPNLGEHIADRFIKNGGNQAIDYNDMQETLDFLIKRKEA